MHRIQDVRDRWKEARRIRKTHVVFVAPDAAAVTAFQAAQVAGKSDPVVALPGEVLYLIFKDMPLFRRVRWMRVSKTWYRYFAAEARFWHDLDLLAIARLKKADLLRLAQYAQHPALLRRLHLSLSAIAEPTWLWPLLGGEVSELQPERGRLHALTLWASSVASVPLW